jgi:hypothetical protein
VEAITVSASTRPKPSASRVPMRRLEKNFIMSFR